jgi:hypothetical protein
MQSKENGEVISEVEGINSNAALKNFLQSLQDRVAEGQVPAIFAFSVMNHLISNQQICSYFCSESKELARDIWLRVKQSGLQVRSPAFLFGNDLVEAQL